MSEELSPIELDQIIDDVDAPPLLPKAWFDGDITEIIEDISEKTGGVYWRVIVTIPLSSFPPDEIYAEAYPDGVKVGFGPIWQPVDRRSIWRLGKFLKKLGQPTNVNTVDPNDWMDLKVQVKIGHRTWQGEAQHNCDDLRPAEEEASPAKKRRGRG